MAGFGTDVLINIRRDQILFGGEKYIRAGKLRRKDLVAVCKTDSDYEYEEIIAFNVKHTNEVHAIRLTFEGFMFAESFTADPEQEIYTGEKYVRVSDVQIGDIIAGKKVTRIDHIKTKGLIAPVTKSGVILVNNIICKADANTLLKACAVIPSQRLRQKVFNNVNNTNIKL